jgi:aspartate carbamoyltransferase catalytic subunit
MIPKYNTQHDIAAAEFCFNQRDIVSINDLSREEIEHILGVANWFKETHKNPRGNKLIEQILNGAAVANVIVEPSTRTRLSFETAARALDARVLSINDPKASSFAKGEPLRDPLKIIEQYILIMGHDESALVMRHESDGSARFAADVLNIPFINAGDGRNEHPTQALLDLFSIHESQGTIDGLAVAIVGDLKYGRTVHSLALALSKYKDMTLYLVSPEQLQMTEFMLDILIDGKVDVQRCASIEEVVDLVDILYMTRIQKERFTDKKEYEKVKNVFNLSASMLKNAKQNMRILHPLPRNKEALEISYDVDDTLHSYYITQARNGLFVREALLALVMGRLGNDEIYREETRPFISEGTCPNGRCISNPEYYEVDIPRFYEINGKLQCHYCGAIFGKEGEK